MEKAGKYKSANAVDANLLEFQMDAGIIDYVHLLWHNMIKNLKLVLIYLQNLTISQVV